MPMTFAHGRTLDQWKADLLRFIDLEAEKERLKYITPGAGQAMVYQEKERQARAYLADHTAESFELITMEAQATGVFPEDVANAVVLMAGKWRLVAAFIEARRLAAKQAVEAAANVEQARWAAVVDWTIPV